MYSTLRSPLFFKTKITTNHTAIYRKKKAFHKAFGKNDRFFTTNKTFESPQTKALFFLQQKLHQSQTEAPPTTNRSSTNHQQKLRQPPTEHPFHPHSFPSFMKEEKKQPFAHRGTLYSSTPVRTEPHPLRIAQERRTFTEI
ncbi:hypothetical protein [Bacteroides xylanisolvens]|uniref:hypothetical protein n=1 Tax=Bacteroides xylanisolvens TaxID=371601 RepID=UPI00129CA449|nr:hypothetical protein [Bacteroides xylanisolvens]